MSFHLLNAHSLIAQQVYELIMDFDEDFDSEDDLLERLDGDLALYAIHNNLRRFSDACQRKFCPFKDVVGFVDGTINGIARATKLQKAVYNGHVKYHGLKYQSIVTPDGITVSLYGPYVGRIHDKKMFDKTGVFEKLVATLDYRGVNGQYYAIYGDSAYQESSALIRPFKDRK
jgi:hypothetical protein